MKLKVVIHQAEEGGYWAEEPAIMPPKRTNSLNWRYEDGSD